MRNIPIYITALVFHAFFCCSVKAQKPSDTSTSFPKHSALLEVFGHARSIVSINYERRLFSIGKNVLSAVRVGFGYTSGLTYDNVKHKGNIGLPVSASLFAGERHHWLKLGLGYTASLGDEFVDSSTVPPTQFQRFESAFVLSLGYRLITTGGVILEFFPLLQWTDNPTNKFGVGFGFCLGYDLEQLKE